MTGALWVAAATGVLAALLHVVIFQLESFGWTGERARRTFGTTPASAEATRELAFNQGFYNLFLAVVAAAGVVSLLVGAVDVGAALLLAGTGSMLAAAVVLLTTSPGKAAAALKQGTFPLVAVAAVLLHLVA